MTMTTPVKKGHPSPSSPLNFSALVVILERNAARSDYCILPLLLWSASELTITSLMIKMTAISDITSGRANVVDKTVETRRMATANWTCVSWVAYAPGTIAVNVTLLERGFNACETPRCICPSVFDRFLEIQAGSFKIRNFSTFLHILASPVYAPRTIAENVTRIEGEFSACQTPRSMYPSIFNHFPVIHAVKSKVCNFSTFFRTFRPPWVCPWVGVN